MSLSLRSTIVRSLLLAGAVAGCNSILDNQPGKLQERATPSVEQNQPVTSDAGGGKIDEPVKDPTPVTAEGCATGTHQCGGTCAAMNDPSYACGADSCQPCAIPHGIAACAGNACAVGTCDKGFADCNGKPDDGCEVDLSKATSCGSCNAVCPAASPVCAPSGETFQCGTGCTPTAPLLCGTECVAPLSSVNHCNGCNAKCPDVANSTSTCTLGQCGFTCQTGFHACGGRCATATDATACGPSCTICPVPANALPTCSGDACGFTCAEHFGDCNANPADGCESNLQNDPLNCRACGVSCGGGTCVDGTCTAPPADPDAGAPPPP